jgi:hypothetical protein
VGYFALGNSVRMKMPKHFSSAYWRARSEQTRALAEPMTDEKLQRSLLDIANEYDKLAELTEAQEHTAD